MTQAAREAIDPAEGNADLAEVEKLICEDAPSVFISNVRWLMGYNPDKLDNFHYSGVYGAYYDRVWMKQ